MAALAPLVIGAGFARSDFLKCVFGTRTPLLHSSLPLRMAIAGTDAWLTFAKWITG
jgi:hypothetical protein